MRKLLLVSLLFLCGCSQKPGTGYSGYIEAQAVSIAAPQSGWLAAVDVDRGDTIRRDEPLFALDAAPVEDAAHAAQARAEAASATALDLGKGAREADIAPLVAQRNQAAAALDLARSNEARYARLEPQGFVSAAQMDSLRAAVKSAQAALDSIDKQIADRRLAARSDQQAAAEAQATAASADAAQAMYNLQDRSVRARMDGRVEERLREPGEFVAAGQPVLTVLPQGREFIRFYVPQGDLPKLNLGQVVHVTCDNCPARTAKIRFISTVAEFTPPVIYSVKERQKLMFLIEATPDRPDAFKAGEPVDVRL